jgi:hypothetical protein
MFKLITNVKRGIVPNLGEVWASYDTVEAARDAATTLGKLERVSHVAIVDDSVPPRFVEWGA